MSQSSKRSRPLPQRSLHNRSRHTVRPLSLGNRLSAGLTLYRSHLKPYFGMSLKAHAWGMIPVYGWAKLHTLSAAIARHAYCELINQPETLKQSQEKLLPKLWGFLLIHLLLFIIFSAIQAVLQTIISIAVNVVQLPFQVFSEANPDNLNLVLVFVLGLVFLGGVIGVVVLYLWLLARLFVPGVAYAAEDDIDMVSSLERSWRLTPGRMAWQVMLMLCIIFAVIAPLNILVFIPPLLLFIPAMNTLSTLVVTGAWSYQAIWELAVMLLLVVLLWMVLSLALAIVVMPMWQTLKATIYYDGRVRREGLGLELRDRLDSSEH